MENERKLKIKDEYLRLIIDLGYDYDGFNDVENLRTLIDEIVEYAKKAYKCDDKSVEFIGGNNNYNILHERI